MNKTAGSAFAALPPVQGVARQPAYSEDARSYDRRTGAFQAYRQAIVEALPVCRGQVVLDVGCGTGLCCGMLVEKVGSQGGVVGIEESPEMAAIARERVAREGWRNVTIVQSEAEEARIAGIADAALFCAVHDILQSPDALQNVMNQLRPQARVAAGGGKWAAPPVPPVPAVWLPSGLREVRVAGRPHQAGVRSVPPRPGSTDQHASSRVRANRSGALMQAP